MLFWKKILNKSKDVCYPRAIVRGKPVETEGSKHRTAISRNVALVALSSSLDALAVYSVK